MSTPGIPTFPSSTLISVGEIAAAVGLLANCSALGHQLSTSAFRSGGTMEPSALACHRRWPASTPVVAAPSTMQAIKHRRPGRGNQAPRNRLPTRQSMQVGRREAGLRTSSVLPARAAPRRADFGMKILPMHQKSFCIIKFVDAAGSLSSLEQSGGDGTRESRRG